MFNRKLFLFLCGLGIVAFLVEGATTLQIASFFTIILSSIIGLRQQDKKLQNG